MFGRNRPKSARSFLQELRSNTAGNTLAMAGMALFPLAAMIGGGVDVSRIYLVQTRLQQACDAGALAGRRQMASGNWTANDNAANIAANNMFRANFDTDAYGSFDGSYAFTENAGTVTGTASVKLDMAVMQMFGYGTKTVTVECDASMSIPNTDVMFVLDVTGSMNCPDTGDTYCGNNGNVEATDARIKGLRSAVKCFYETLAKRDSGEDCGSTPSAGSENTAHLRFGFVPYSTNVNVGKLLPNDYLADEWTYQSREAVTKLENVVVDYTPGTPYLYRSDLYYTDKKWSSSSTVETHYNVTSSWACSNLQPEDYDDMSGTEGSAYDESTWISDDQQITRWYTDETGTSYDYSTSYSSRHDRCSIELRTRGLVRVREYRQVDTPVYEQQQVFSHYDYKPVTFDVSPLKAGGSTWNHSLDLPVGTEGLDTGVPWDGCIEERQTVRTTDFDPIPTDAYDLDIDRLPTTGDPATQWGPTLREAVWDRYNSSGYRTTDTVSTASNLGRYFSYYCASEARKLQRWDTPSEFDSYLDGLDAIGSTYHDIGLIWGARLLSPTGIFASENAATANGGAIDRHLIFMTDGDTMTSNLQYTSYGVEWYDRRRTSSGSAPSNNDLTTQVNSRFLAMCNAIKNQNITLWVVSFGNGVSETAITNLENCATSGKFYNASSSADLLDNFRSIANDISQLRLTN